MRALYKPLKGICRALIPSFPTKNQGVPSGSGFRFWGSGFRVVELHCLSLLDLTLALAHAFSLF